MQTHLRAIVIVGTAAAALACSLISAPAVPTPTGVTAATTSPVPSHVPLSAPTRMPLPTLASLPAPLRPVIAIEGLLPGEIRRLQGAPGEGLWVITDQAVARYTNDTLTTVVAGFEGTVAGIDVNGRVWVAAEDASVVSAWDGKSRVDYGADAGWTPVPLEDGWYREVGWGQSDQQGNFWLTTSQDVRWFDGTSWTVFTPEEMGMGAVAADDLWSAFVLGVAGDGTKVWVGQCDWGGPGPFGGQGVRWFDGTAWHAAHASLTSGCATAIAAGQSGSVWLGIGQNLWRCYPSGECAPFAAPEPSLGGMRFGFAEFIAVDRSGDAWPAMVLCGGASCYGSIALYHVCDGAWTPIGEAADYGGRGGPFGIVFDSGGTPWLFWDSGVFQLTGDTPELLASLSVLSSTADIAGRVWFVAVHEGRAVLATIDR